MIIDTGLLVPSYWMATPSSRPCSGLVSLTFDTMGVQLVAMTTEQIQAQSPEGWVPKDVVLDVLKI